MHIGLNQDSLMHTLYEVACLHTSCSAQHPCVTTNDRTATAAVPALAPNIKKSATFAAHCTEKCLLIETLSTDDSYFKYGFTFQLFQEIFPYKLLFNNFNHTVLSSPRHFVVFCAPLLVHFPYFYFI